MRVKGLDGLRCISIGMVLFYHYGVFWEDSGFVGVDIFFVLSGFLISNNLLLGFPLRKIGLTEFWKRRILRLFPDSFILLIIVIFWNQNSGRLQEMGRKVNEGVIESSILVYSNWYYILESDYFGLGSYENILLHTWSLSVEDQFYLIWPLTVILV
jgi:peptidoglycan/LPS O-acetylase OafA/YrhL